MLTGKNPSEHGKTSGASANGATSQRYFCCNFKHMFLYTSFRISISERVAISLCSGETGSDSSSEGSEGNSHNVSLAEFLLHFCCIFVMYTQ